jgi:hypothetical protein
VNSAAYHTFADLLTPAEWRRLPSAIRRRFANSFAAGQTICYRGYVVETRLSPLGWLLAQLTRIIGAPLPLNEETGMATVVVTDHPGNQGQVWSRLYHRTQGLPQAIHSVKRFSGPTGLEEYLGFGLSVALELKTTELALSFIGRDYFFSVAGLRFKIPDWLSPGRLTVVHLQEYGDHFSFSLQLEHPRFGCLVYQLARFVDEQALTSAATEASNFQIHEIHDVSNSSNR